MNDVWRRLVRASTAHLGVVILLIVLIATAYANVIFRGRSLVPSDQYNPLDYRFNEAAYGPGFVPAEYWSQRGMVPYPNIRDPEASWWQGEPAAELLRRSIARGEFPFWDPYIGGGTPSMAALVPAYLFPPSLVVVLLGNTSGLRTAYILLLFFVAALATYLLLRKHGLGARGSFAGAVAFLFCGALVQTGPSFLGQPVALFPVALLLTRWFLDRPGGKRAAVLAASYACIALASFPAILLQVFGLCAVYAVLDTIAGEGETKERAGRVLRYAGACLCGVALVGAYYLPAAKVSAAATHVLSYYAYAGAAKHSPLQLPQLLSPTIMGGCTIYSNPVADFHIGTYFNYTGVVALFLAAAGVLTRASSRRQSLLKWTVSGAALLAMLKILGIQPVQSIATLPFFRTIHYLAYFGVVICFAVAILCGFGVEALEQRRVRMAHWILPIVGTAGALYWTWWIATTTFRLKIHPQNWRWYADFRLLIVFAVLVAILTLIAVKTARASFAATLLIIGVLALEGITNASYPRQIRADVWRNPPSYVRAIDRLGVKGRLVVIGRYSANMPSVYQDAVMDSLTLFTSPRVFTFYDRYFAAATTSFLRQTRKLPPEPVLDVANVEMVVAAADNQRIAQVAAQRGYELAFEDNFVKLFRRRTLPRYFFTSAYRVVDPFLGLGMLAERDGTDPRSILLDVDPRVPAVANNANDPLPTLTHFGLNEVKLTVDAPRDGLLYCSESSMDGWTATVDSRETPILSANYAFRAIRVPRGRHEIRLHYRPPGLMAGLALSLIGAVGCIGAAVRGRKNLPSA